jgi:hypothetical protein
VFSQDCAPTSTTTHFHQVQSAKVERYAEKLLPPEKASLRLGQRASQNREETTRRERIRCQVIRKGAKTTGERVCSLRGRGRETKVFLSEETEARET